MMAGALGRVAGSDAAVQNAAPGAGKSLKILILGGTGYIGVHHARAALARGHQVSVFSRGETKTDLPSDVERLIGDRNANLESIRNRDWDAVLDLATYVPKWVRTLGNAIGKRVRQYVFISTASVYESPAANVHGTDEMCKVVEYSGAEDPYSFSELLGHSYAAMKVLCEREAEAQFPRRTLVVRPGAIVGPGDSVGGFTYWAVRIGLGGEALAVGNPLTQVQMVDVRDLAEWVIRMVERRQTGTFNAIGPAAPLGWAEMLGALRGDTAAPTSLTWVPKSWLSENKMRADAALFWPDEAGQPGVMRMVNNKALAQGLSFRPILQTKSDTLSWYGGLSTDLRKRHLLGFEGMSGIEESIANEKKIVEAWHAYKLGSSG